MIPQGWQPIGEPDIPHLSPDAEKVFSVMQFMKKPAFGIIRMKTRLGDNRIAEAIYEIRKMEAIRMGKLTNQQRAAIYQAHKDGIPQKELAEQYGVSVQAISQLVAKLSKAEKKLTAMPVDKQKPGIINPDFDAAVNEMIAESKSADAEEKSENAETEKSSADIPDYVLYAVDCRIADLEHRLQDFADQKAMLEHDLRRLQENIESVQDEHDKLADWKLEVDP